MSKFTFTCQFTPDQLDRCNISNKITFEFEADTLDQILGQFTDFLKGAGFHLDGCVQISELDSLGDDEQQ